MGQPLSKIYVCAGIKLNKSQQHTIWFDTQAQQHEYFLSKVVKTFTGYTFLRKSWSIKVAESYDNTYGWNYLCFRNGDNATYKTYFYFIDRVEYVSDNTVELFLELDVLQTYRWDYGIEACFIDREHSASDLIGEHTLDEGVELGEFVVNTKNNVNLGEPCILLSSTIDPLKTTTVGETTILGSNLDGVFSGLGVFATLMTDFQALATQLANLKEHSDAILTMWMFATNFVKLQDGYTWTDGKASKLVDGSKTFTTNTTMNTSLDGYTPRNNKLFTYPYNFIYVSNNDGGACTYHYEKFKNYGGITFKVYGSPSPEGQIKLIPLEYKNVAINNDEALTGPSFPTCAWNQDVYKIWLAQNQNQLALSETQNIVTGGLGALQLITSLGQEGLDDVASGVNGVLSTIAMKRDKELQPPQAKGKQSSAINILSGHQTFTIMKKSVDKNHAKIIDDFFTMYGYKCNRIKKPNHHVRESFTYTKTINCQIYGNVPNQDIVEIQNIYNRGVTFWVDGDSIGDYSLPNDCI